MAKRIAKQITNPKDIEFLLGITEEEGTRLSFIMELFGEFNGKVRFNTYDTFIVPKGAYGKEGKKNKDSFLTTVGIWVFNKVFIENELFDLYGYINEPINKKMVGKITDKIGYAVLEEKVPLDALKNFLMKTQKFMPYVSVLANGYSMKLLTITKVINKAKADLVKKYRDRLDKNDPDAVIAIQDELLKLAKETLKDDVGIDTYNSGARGSFSNDFKNMFIMKGITKNPDPTKGYNIIMSNYIEGIAKEEYADFANSLAEGPYSRSNKTEVGGYWEKLMLPAFQHVKVGKKGSDCGTKRTVTVTLNDKNIKEYMYCNIKEGNKLVELNTDNLDKYLGKTVQFRFASMCEAKDGIICNACAGNLFHKLGITNVGAAMPQIASKLKLIAMKAFHDSQVVMTKMDPDKAFGFDK